MKSKKWVLVVAALAAAPAYSATFTNGGFEAGNLNGWSSGGGNWNTQVLPQPSTFLPGGSNFNPSVNVNATVSPGLDSRTDNNLNQVRFGNFSARINDPAVGARVGVLSQTVSNYTGTSINFSWAAVLEGAHGADDAANFSIVLRNDTTGTELYSQTFSAATGTPNSSLFTLSSQGWYYTPWQDVSQTVTAGDTYTITLLAADCFQVGHGGYAYLDGFGTTAGGPGDDGGNGGNNGGGTVPVPGSLALVGIGLLGLGRLRRRG